LGNGALAAAIAVPIGVAACCCFFLVLFLWRRKSKKEKKQEIPLETVPGNN
jgi:hypothetical protein